MTQTKADRRRYEREYKRRVRADARAAGRPELAVVNAAIVEAISYTLAGVNIGLKPGERASFVNTTQVGRVALRILCMRQSYDFDYSKRMVIEALSPRSEHRWPSHVPSWAHVMSSGLPQDGIGSA